MQSNSTHKRLIRLFVSDLVVTCYNEEEDKKETVVTFLPGTRDISIISILTTAKLNQTCTIGPL